MVTVVTVEDFDLDKGSLDAAVDTYLDFRLSEEIHRNVTQEALNTGHSWLNHHELTANTVLEYATELRESTGDKSSPLSDEEFEKVEAKVADDAKAFVEDLESLFADESLLEDRVERFRTNQDLDLPIISAFLATADPDRYVLYDEETFETVIRYFTGVSRPDLGDLSVGKRYDLFQSYCLTTGTSLDEQFLFLLLLAHLRATHTEQQSVPSVAGFRLLAHRVELYQY